MKLNVIKKWVGIGIAEIVFSLILIAIAPVFLNSDKPIFGFLIWLGVPTVLGSSGFYVVIKLQDAQKARKLFISRFPEYSYLQTHDFLEFSSSHVSQNLEILEAAKNDPDLSTLNISLFELLQDVNKP